MSDKIEKILNSIKGIKPAEVKPYFYTRLSTKLDTVQNKEAFYLNPRILNLESWKSLKAVLVRPSSLFNSENTF